MAYRLEVKRGGMVRYVRVADNSEIDALNAHLTNQSNPHAVTAVQAGAVPESGGVFSGNITIPAATADGHALNRGTANTLYVKIADLATQSQAEAGTNNTQWMSPLRVKQAIDALGSGSPFTGLVEILADADNQALLRLSHPTAPTAAGYEIGFSAVGGVANTGVSHYVEYSDVLHDFMQVERETRNVTFSNAVSFGGNISIPNATAGGHALNRTTADGRYARLSGATFSGDVQVNNSNITIEDNSTASSFGFFIKSTSGVPIIALSADTSIKIPQVIFQDLGTTKASIVLDRSGNVVTGASRNDISLGTNSGVGTKTHLHTEGIIRLSITSAGNTEIHKNIASTNPSRTKVVTIADNSFAKIGDVSNNVGVAVVMSGFDAAMFNYRSDSLFCNKLNGTTVWTANTGTPTGTSGPDTDFNFFVNSSGEVFIENRFGSTRDFKFLLIG